MKNLFVFLIAMIMVISNSMNGYAQQSNCAVQASDSAICLGGRVILSVTLPKPDATNTISVPIGTPLYSGLASWDYKPGVSLIGNYSWTYGLPGMLVYGDSTQRYGAVEAEIQQSSGGAFGSAGVAMAVNRNTNNDGHPFNGPGCYFLFISGGRVSLNNGAGPGEIIGADVPGLLPDAWNKLKLEILPNAHIYGYVNDMLYIEYAIPTGIVPKGRFALVTMNGGNQYKDVSSYTFPLEILWSTGETTTSIAVKPTQTMVYSVAVKGAFQTCTNFIDIVVNQPAFSTLNASICKGEKYRFNNQNLTLSGSYTISLISAAGCDSTATLNLTVKESSASTMEITTCDSYTAQNGMVYTQSGTYKTIIPNVLGCDSIITTKLTVLHPVTPDITIVGDTLTSLSSYISYQWYDGSGRIKEATSKQFIIKKSGSYFLEAIDRDGCKSVSTPVQLIYSSSEVLPTNERKITVMPNPSNGKFRVRIEGIGKEYCKMQVINATGQVLWVMDYGSAGNFEDQVVDVSGLAKGIYYLQFVGEKFRQSEKVIIQ